MKKRRLSFEGVIGVMLCFSFALFLGTRIFLTSYNVQLEIAYQNNQESIKEISSQIETLQLDLQGMTTFDRVKDIVEDDGFVLNQDSSITIVN